MSNLLELCENFKIEIENLKVEVENLKIENAELKESKFKKFIDTKFKRII